MFAERIANNPLFGAATAVVTVLAGGLASFYPDEITSSHWLVGFGDTFSPAASAFWLSVALAGCFLAGGQWAQSRRSLRATARLAGMVAKLETLPTGNFLPDWQEACRLSVRDGCAALMTQAPSKSVAGVEQLIRNLIAAIAHIAQQFDRAGNVQYGAGIMLWRPADASSRVALERNDPHIVVPWFQGDQRASGVLELVPALTATVVRAPTPPCAADPNAHPLVFPVPADDSAVYDNRHQPRTAVLPGAASAFVRSEFAHFLDIGRFVQWIDERTSIDHHASKAMKDYFLSGGGKHIQSFCSLPILPPRLAKGDSANIGVLNLYSTQKGLLAENGQTLFVPLLEPFLVILSMLLLDREDLLVKQGHPPPTATKAGGP